MPEGDGSAEGMPGGSPEPYDQDAVIREGGDPAVKQYKDAQRAVSRATSQLAKYKALDPFIDQFGGGQGIVDELTRWYTLRANPRMAKLVDQFEQTGVPPTDAGEYEEPTEEDPRDAKIRELESTVNRLEGRVGKQDMRQHFVRLQEEFAADWEELLPKLEEQLQQWERNPQQRSILNNLTYDTLQMVALKTLYGDPEARAKRGQRDYQRLVDLKKARATEEPSRTATTGQEPRVRKQHPNALEALQEFKTEHGITEQFRYPGR
jgi:hypothetical protein